MTKRLDLSRLRLILMAALVGLAAGMVVSAFRFTIEISQRMLPSIYRWLATHPLGILGWLMVMMILALVIGHWLGQLPMIKGSGIPQVEGQLRGELDYAWWPVLWRKFLGGVLGIGAGLFLGREGPSIQLGSSIGQGVAETSHESAFNRRVLIAAGAAAGLSAAFNAPIAATLFILEEVYHNFSSVVWMTSLTSALLADMVATGVFGLTPVLAIHYQMSLPLHLYGLLIVLGLILGLMGKVYQWATLHSGQWYQQLFHRLPTRYDGLVPLILIVPIGLWWPTLLGGGNQIIVTFAKHSPAFWALIGVFILRFVFSTVSYGSGLPGGIFLPILTLGALLGAIVAQGFVGLGWLSSAFVANFIIYAMAGYFAGIAKAPFTALLLITEMVGSLQHLMPLAIVAIVAYVTVDVLNGAPIYQAMLEAMVRPTLKADHHPDQLQLAVEMGSLMANRPVRSIEWPETALLSQIERHGQLVIPHGDTIIRAGDILIVTTDRGSTGTVRQALEQLSQSK